MNGKVTIERQKAQEHCIERAWERHRIKLTHEQVWSLSLRIGQGEGIDFGVPQANGNRKRGRGVLIDIDDGRAIAVLWVPGIGCVTVLPPNAKQVIKAVMAAKMAARLDGSAKTIPK